MSRVVVTGGGGYVGRHIVRQLLQRGDEVVVWGRRTYPRVEAWGARCEVVDLSQDNSQLAAMLEGVDVVFHVAALPPYWAPLEVFQATNVEGTRRVIAACQAAGVSRLVYTSSPSATFDGSDAEGKTEAECPYPSQFDTPYAQTKAEGERLVLAANSDALATTSLRPHLVYGPEEPHMLPRVIGRNRRRRLAVIGEGTNRVGLTYVENAAAAHLQAADALSPGSRNAGRAYFVHDDEPVSLWAWIKGLLHQLDEPALKRTVSLSTARRIGRVMEWLWTWLPLPGEPPMTRFVATQLATSHWYDLSAAREDFGWHAPYSGEEGLAATVRWFREHPV